MKMLINSPSGVQDVIEIGEGGSYFDNVRVLWDERTDGPMPAITLGGMVRQGSALVFSQASFDLANQISLTMRKAAAWERIKAERDLRKFAGVRVGSDWFHCDLESRSQWERMANKAAKLGLTGTDPYTIGGQPVPWKTMTGTFVLLTAGKIFAVVDAVELQEAMIFGRAEQHRIAMEASATPESYDISGGWPASIEDGV